MGQDGGVATRSGDAQAEHVAKAPDVTPAGVQFVEYPVFASLLGGHAHRRGDPLDADRGGIERRSSADEYVRVPGQGPTMFPVGQPSSQALPDRLGERDDAFIHVEASVAEIGQLQCPQLARSQSVEGRDRYECCPGGVLGAECFAQCGICQRHG